MNSAPPPYTDGTYTPDSFKTDEYKKGGFLQHINASSAYAHGYTGYIVSRVKDNNFGQLTNGQSSDPGQAKDITSNRIAVAVLSTGTEIKNTISGTDENGNPIYSRYVNMDLAVENPKLDENGNVVKNTSGQVVGNGTWSGNLAHDSSGQLFGYNFDYGYKVNGSQAMNFSNDGWHPVDPNARKAETLQTNSYYSGTQAYFLDEGEGGYTDEADKIKEYIRKNLGGNVYMLCGLSMGGRIAATIAKDNSLMIGRLVLDGAPLKKMPSIAVSFMKSSYKSIIKKSKVRDKKILESCKRDFLPEDKIPDFLAVADKMEYISIDNILESVFSDFEYVKYNSNMKILFMHGTKGNESVSMKCAAMMKKVNPQTVIKSYKGYAHAHLACFEQPKWIKEVETWMMN